MRGLSQRSIQNVRSQRYAFGFTTTRVDFSIRTFRTRQSVECECDKLVLGSIGNITIFFSFQSFFFPEFFFVLKTSLKNRKNIMTRDASPIQSNSEDRCLRSTNAGTNRTSIVGQDLSNANRNKVRSVPTSLLLPTFVFPYGDK